MEYFFKINRNAKIGWKQLTRPDLGLSSTSNLTHIGLYKNTLQFLNEEHKTGTSKLIYKGQIFELLSILDFITRADGRIDAPKIRMGRRQDLNIEGEIFSSVTKKIWDIVREENVENNWYLIWFGLASSELVFYLIEENSEEFNKLKEIIINFGNNSGGIVSVYDENFSQLILYLESIIDYLAVDYIKKLELLAQTNEVPLNIIKPRYFDIERAKLNFQLTGKKGEELIAEYLDRQKTQGIVNDFNWVNQSRESSFPYDFQIINNDGSKIFTDVKTTAFDFNQKMIVSINEFNFINQNPTNYHIYRVYNLNNNQPSLRICRNINQIGEHIMNHTNQLTTNLSPYSTSIQSLKFAIQPNNNILNFDDTIAL